MTQPSETVVHDAIIVGGGHNGLVCAAYLAKAGLDVLVLERRSSVGGACATEELFPGYRISTCSYVAYILQDKVVRDLDLWKNGYQVHPLPIKRMFPYPDGRSLVLWNDTERTAREISRKFSQKDATGYVTIQDFWWRAARLFDRYFLCEPPTIGELQDSVRGTEDEALLERLLYGTLTGLVDELFESDAVKAAAISHIMAGKGMDEEGLLFAYAATKPNSLVDYNNQGIVVGGMGTISEAISRSAQGAGCKVRCDAEVKQILIEYGRACGVKLAGGQIIRSHVVISNADPKRTFLGLVGRENIAPTVATSIEMLETTHATLKFHAAVSELPDFSRYLGSNFDPTLIATIGIGPTTAYYRKSIQDALDGEITTCPVIDVQIPTVYDHTVAPKGRHIVSMWVRFLPVRPKAASWDSLRACVGEQLIDLLTGYAPNFRRSLIHWLVYTPADIERRLYMTDGNFRHTDHISGQLLAHRLFSRGGHRTPIPRLYMCGAGTHPGGDVSGAPGHNAAHVILGEWAREGGD
ncbi:MAG: phytoene desaturase family protein [Pseudonocardiaceae bacterium]